MKQKNKTVIVLGIVVVAMMASMPAYAGLDATIHGISTFISLCMKLLNLCVGFIGAWYVASGIMAWKKSSEQGSNQMGFKEIIVPVISGIILLGFASFIVMTSSTFGFASNAASQFGM